MTTKASRALLRFGISSSNRCGHRSATRSPCDRATNARGKARGGKKTRSQPAETRCCGDLWTISNPVLSHSRTSPPTDGCTVKSSSPPQSDWTRELQGEPQGTCAHCLRMAWSCHRRRLEDLVCRLTVKVLGLDTTVIIITTKQREKNRQNRKLTCIKCTASLSNGRAKEIENSSATTEVEIRPLSTNETNSNQPNIQGLCFYVAFEAPS